MKEVGIVTKANNYLLELKGLPHARVNLILKNESGARAVVSELKDQSVIALMIDRGHPKPGDLFFPQPEGITLPAAEKLLGRVVNPLGRSLDRTAADIAAALTRGQTSSAALQLGATARGIKDRELVKNQLKTGFTVVDTLVPIGLGQKEAVFGEPRSGKTSFILDVIRNQRGRDTICIYASIGRPEMDVKRFAQNIKKSGSDEYTVIISASPREPVPLIALTPEIAFNVAENFERQGRDVLLVLDDLGTHAKILREIALLSGRIPGRESYPGDIFYQHAHLIERAGNFNKEKGGGSLTLLPVMETDFESMSQLLPTNLIASTDGHLFFSARLYAQGQYPAISVEQSITRVGKQTQNTLQKSLSERLRNLLADYENLKKFSLFGAELTPSSRQRIKKGEMAREMLAQQPQENIPVATQVLFLSLLFTSFLDKKDLAFLRRNRKKILEVLSKAPEFRALTVKAQDLDLSEVITILNNYLGVIEKACPE
jgi:F-type H+-transporting ATPase subunit alpha